MGPIIEVILRPIVLGLLMAFALFTIVIVIADIKKKQLVKSTVIVVVIFIFSVYLFVFAGRYMLPRVETGNLSDEFNTITSQLKDDEQASLTTDAYDIVISVKASGNGDSTYESLYQRMSGKEKLLSKKETQNDVNCLVSAVSTRREFKCFLASGSSGEITLQKDDTLVYITYYRNSSDKTINYIADSFVPVSFFYRPKLNLPETVDLLVKENENKEITQSTANDFAS